MTTVLAIFHRWTRLPSYVVASLVAGGAFTAPQALAQPQATAEAGNPTLPAATGSAAASPAAVPAPDLAPGSTASPAVAEARAAFQSGIALAKAESWAPALQAFERSDALHPHAITTYNIGYCERHLGHFTRARKMLAKALADHRARGEVELPDELVSAVEAYLIEVDKQIARVVLTSTTGALTVDGRPLELAEDEGLRPVLLAGTRAVGPPEPPPAVTVEVLLDPGTHLFVLSVKGRADVRTSETLSPGSRSWLELQPSDVTGDSKRPARAPEAAAPPETTPNRTPAFVAFGVGSAALAVGTVSGLMAFGKKSDVKQACEEPGAPRCSSERESGNRAADIATGAFITAGAAIGVGAALFFTASGNKTKPGKTATLLEVRPMLTCTSIGLEGRF